MKGLSRLILFLTFFFLPFPLVRSAQQSNPDTNAKIKATYLFSFTKYIDWPAKYKQGNFIIGVLGTTPLLSELNTMASLKKVGDQPLEIKTFTSPESLTKCHMLLISADQSAQLKEALAKLKGSSTLIVAEKPGLARQGAAINFVVQNNKQLFELNKANASKFELAVSSKLEALAIMVE